MICCSCVKNNESRDFGKTLTWLPNWGGWLFNFESTPIIICLPNWPNNNDDDNNDDNKTSYFNGSYLPNCQISLQQAVDWDEGVEEGGGGFGGGGGRGGRRKGQTLQAHYPSGYMFTVF